MVIGVNCTEAILLKDRRNVFAAMKDVGVDRVRVELPWDFRVTTAMTDALVNDLQAAQLEPLVMVTFHKSLWGSVPAVKLFADRMRTYVSQYPQIRLWQLWNEQNAQRFWPRGNPDTFLPYLQAGYTEVKEANPDATVVLGGLAAAVEVPFPLSLFGTNVAPWTWMQRILAKGGGDYFDVAAVHPYSWNTGFQWQPFSPTLPFVQGIAKLRAMLNKPLWVTEYGFPIDKFTAVQQRDNLAAQTQHLTGVCERQYIYCYRDSGKTAYGLVDATNTPRPAHDWLREVVQ